MGQRCTKPQLPPPTAHYDPSSCAFPLDRSDAVAISRKQSIRRRATGRLAACVPAPAPAPALCVRTCRSAVTLASTSVDEHDSPAAGFRCKPRSDSRSSWISSSCWVDSPRGLVFRGSSVISDIQEDGRTEYTDGCASDDERSVCVGVGGDEFDDAFHKRAIAFERRAQLDGFLSPTHRVLQSNDPVTMMPALALTTSLDPFESLRSLDGDDDSEDEGVDVNVNVGYVGHPCVPPRAASAADVADVAIHAV